MRFLPSDAKVCDLLDLDTNWWNTSMVQNVFNAEEAQVICSMAVCPRNRKDHLVWVGTKHSDYTVHSAYHMVKENGIREGGSCSNTQDMAALWKGIWKINCATMVKTFLWQACTNILPTKELLFKQHITADPLCHAPKEIKRRTRTKKLRVNKENILNIHSYNKAKVKETVIINL
jgi:hypothetical protein